jgi:membrane protein DedA with SNARE-associated domain
MAEFLRDYGLVVLFAVVFLQAMGVGGPPGKTTLVAAAILASKGSLPIVGVLAVGTVALALGGYVGYWIGRRGGRPLVDRFLPQRLEPLVGRAERFFAAHGPRAVFTARFLPGLKVVAAPAAGLAHMPWRSFLLWHTLAAIVFTLGFGLAAFVAGAAAIELLEHYGAYALVPVAAALAVLIVLRRRRQRARADEPADALA